MEKRRKFDQRDQSTVGFYASSEPNAALVARGWRTHSGFFTVPAIPDKTFADLCEHQCFHHTIFELAM